MGADSPVSAGLCMGAKPEPWTLGVSKATPWLAGVTAMVHALLSYGLGPWTLWTLWPVRAVPEQS